ncbi:MAG: hypothetical protein GY749_47265 [Desulfobacteraceae bacterium]|nr:hypothetical protein [Desulfobacteraceae bacterium]
MNEHDDERAQWEIWDRKRRRYFLYFFAGIGINFILYFTKPYGFDPSRSILWGSFFGIVIPIATMFALTYIHEKIFGI